MEVGQCAKDGTLSAGQAGMPVCAAHWSDKSQNAAGTRRADYPQLYFWLLLVFLKVTPPEGQVLFGHF